MQIFALWPHQHTPTDFQVFASSSLGTAVGLPTQGRLSEVAARYREWLLASLETLVDDDPRFVVLKRVWLFRPSDSSSASSSSTSECALDELDRQPETLAPAGSWSLGPEARAFLRVNVDGTVSLNDHDHPLPLDVAATVIAAEIKRRQQAQADMLATMEPLRFDDEAPEPEPDPAEPTANMMAAIGEARRLESELGRELTREESNAILAKHGWLQ